MGAQNELSANLIALRSSGTADPALIAQGDAQLGALLALKRQLANATPATFAMVRAEIAACVGTASSLALQAQAAIATGMGSPAELAAASQAARSAVTSFSRDYYEKKSFDPYLTFASDEDAERFRRDEARRKNEIDEAMALHTPEGDLRAANLSIAQLQDAGAHGADRSPAFKGTLDAVTASRDGLAMLVDDGAHQKAKDARTDAVDQPATGAAAAVDLPPDLLAAIQAAKMTVADHHEKGHGLAEKDVAPRPTTGRT